MNEKKLTKELKALNEIAVISEILVDVSKLHTTPEEAIQEIRNCNLGDNYFIIRDYLKRPSEEENLLEIKKIKTMLKRYFELNVMGFQSNMKDVEEYMKLGNDLKDWTKK